MQWRSRVIHSAHSWHGQCAPPVSYNTLLGLLPADYIMKRKMVPIEEAATEFGLRSSEVVDRIQVGLLAACPKHGGGVLCCAGTLYHPGG